MLLFYFGHIPSKIDSTFIGLTAEQWCNWTLIYSMQADDWMRCQLSYIDPNAYNSQCSFMSKIINKIYYCNFFGE